jgi:hypothetical protein
LLLYQAASGKYARYALPVNGGLLEVIHRLFTGRVANYHRSMSRLRLGLRQPSGALATATPNRKRQRTGAVQNLAEKERFMGNPLSLLCE